MDLPPTAVELLDAFVDLQKSALHYIFSQGLVANRPPAAWIAAYLIAAD